MSAKRVIFLNSAYEGAPRALSGVIADGRVAVVEEEALLSLRPGDVGGLIVSSHVDQIWLAKQKAWVEAFLNSGGRLFFNGHVESDFLDGLGRYRALVDRGTAAFKVTPAQAHAIWHGYSSDELTFRKGVAGFYGRGHNVPPAGAVAINVLDAEKEAAPVDWEWTRPQGGRVISHAGNDIWTTFEDLPANTGISTRMVAWLEGRA